jgi:glycosyltransferase involved in cell wall biosynthesis
MKISIVIPVFNEEKTVEEIVDRVKKLNMPYDKEVIVVDDGSSDGSFEKIKQIKGIKFFAHKKNKGKGAAVKTAIKHFTGDILIIQDADLELEPEQIPNLVKPIADKKALVVYGSRNLHNQDGARSPIYYVGGIAITLITDFLFGIKLTDEPCGYKVFAREVLENIKIDNNRFEWEPEITAKIAKRKIKILELPVQSKSRSIKEGKKLRRIDGIKALWTLIKYRFKS